MSAEPPQFQIATDQFPPYDPQWSRARTLTGWLWASIIGGALALPLSVPKLLHLLTLDGSAALSFDDELPTDGIDALAAGLFFIPWLGSMIWLMIWLYRVVANLKRLGAAGYSYSPLFAALSFFVPIWNLFYPRQMAVHSWQASTPQFDFANRISWRPQPAPVLFTLWWAFFIFSNITGNAFDRVTNTETVASQLTGQFMWIATIALTVVAACCALPLVRMIEERQRARHARIIGEAEARETTPAFVVAYLEQMEVPGKGATPGAVTAVLAGGVDRLQTEKYVLMGACVVYFLLLALYDQLFPRALAIGEPETRHVLGIAGALLYPMGIYMGLRRRSFSENASCIGIAGFLALGFIAILISSWHAVLPLKLFLLGYVLLNLWILATAIRDRRQYELQR